MERIDLGDRGLPVRFLREGLERARAVGRVVLREEGGAPRAYATGFLVSPDLVMTCSHVIPDVATAARAVIEFDYVETAGDTFARPKAFAFEPERTFVTDEERDFTIISVATRNDSDDALSGRPFIPVDPRAGKLIVGEEINLLHHPFGEPMQLLARGNVVRDIFDDLIHFDGFTRGGSTGAPVLNDQWELVGLHHGRVPVPDGDGVTRCEAIRLSSVLTSLLSVGARDVLAKVFAADDNAIDALPEDPAPATSPSPQPAATPQRITPVSDVRAGTPSATPDTVFLCYARDDQGQNHWKDRLDRQLRAISRFKDFSVWHDGRIAAGADWEAEIDLALHRCGAAVLLIGPSFLTSDFIQDNELPVLLQAHQNKGVEVFPLITDFCPYRHSPLARFQSVNDPAHPLEELEPSDQNRLLLDVAERVAAAFDEGRG